MAVAAAMNIAWPALLRLELISTQAWASVDFEELRFIGKVLVRLIDLRPNTRLPPSFNMGSERARSVEVGSDSLPHGLERVSTNAHRRKPC